MIYKVKSSDETERLGYLVAQKLSESGQKRAFIAFRGEVGVGKTVFTRGFASFFGIKGVKSPTYTVVNQYSADNVQIFHFDFYRIESEDDRESIAYYDYLKKDGYCIGEWCEKIPHEIPTDAISVSISRDDESELSRTVTIEGVEL